jgi:outer membrane protein assembly factor BamB
MNAASIRRPSRSLAAIAAGLAAVVWQAALAGSAPAVENPPDRAAIDTGSADAAPAEAWPMARGCLAGTGRSEVSLRLPLAEAWRRDFEKTSFSATAAIADGTVFIGDLDGTFHAVSLADGTSRWTFKTEAAGFPSAAAVSLDAAHPLVVVGDDTGVVRGFDAKTGAVRWEYETDGEISGGPTILPATPPGSGGTTAGGTAATGPRVLIGSQDASLSCLSLADGTVLWKHSIADQIRCSPTVARTADGDRVFLAGCDGKLHVIDAANGTELAAVPIDGPTGTTPAVLGDRVFFGTEGGAFFAIDFVKKDVAWRVQPAGNPQSYRSSAAVAGEVVVVGSRGRAVEAFAMADGGRRWRHPMRGRVDASPTVVALADDDEESTRDAVAPLLAIVADSAGTIAALNAATGEPAWSFDAGGGFSGGAAVAAGRVVIASDDGTLWCFAAP